MRKLVFTLVLLAGCVTTKEVRAIVDESNAATLLAETEVRGAVGAATDTEGVVARIDAFIARHKDNPGLARTINALRLRKALLLLVGGKSNMAKAAFAAYDSGLAGNERDLGLYRAYPALTWWWQAAGTDSVSAASFEKNLNTLNKAIRPAPKGSGIRYYLITLRAQIQLKWATLERDPRPRLKSGLKAYAMEFDAAAQESVAKFESNAADLADVPTESLRWFGHARITFKAYDDYYRRWLADSELTGAPEWPPETRWLVPGTG